ncbi:MAG: leukotoxin LktA family filamentous adhesin, partial [Pseudomonadota bacterium]
MHWNPRSPRRTALAVALLTAFGGAAHAAPPIVPVGVGGPALSGQAGNLIVPTGTTATVLKVNKNVTDITTGTIKGTVGVNAFSHFQVGQNNVVNLHVPSAATALLNLVYDSPILVNGIVNGFKDGSLGGNVMFADPHGMIVGAGGVLNVGSLTVATPTRQFMDGVIGTDGEISSLAVTRLLDGGAPNSADGVIRIDGRVNALQSIRLRAAQVDINGALKAGADVAHQAAFAGAVNSAGIAAAGALVERDGVIEIVADGAASVAGSIDVARRAGAGAGGSATVFGDSVALAAGARIDAAGTDGGGAIKLGTMAGPDGAHVYARELGVGAGALLNADALATGAGGTVLAWGAQGNRFFGAASARGGAQGGDGGFVEVSARNGLLFDGRVDTSAAHGKMGTLLLDPVNINIVNDLSQAGENKVTVASLQGNGNTNFVIKADNKLTVGGSDASAADVDLSASLTGNANTITLEGLQVDFNAGSKLRTGGGNVLVKGRQITLGAGALIDTVAAAAPGAGGNVTLAASHDDVRGGMGARTAAASVVVNGAISANNVTLSASAKAESDVSLDAVDDTMVEDALGAGGALLGFKWANGVSKASASVTLGSTAVVGASGNIEIAATGSQKAMLDVRQGDSLNPLANTVAAHGKVEGGARAQVDTGATLSAVGNLSVMALNTSELSVKGKVFSYSADIGATLAYGESSIDTSATIASGAKLSVGGGLDVIGRSKSANTVQAVSSAWNGGKAGIALAISDLRDDAVATLGADVATTGNVRVQAENLVSKNFSKAATETGSGFAAKNINPVLMIPAQGGQHVLTTSQSFGVNIVAAHLQRAAAASGSAGSSETTLKIGAALSVLSADFSANASIAPKALVSAAQGDIAVFAKVADHPIHNIAQSAVNSATSSSKATSTDPAAKYSVSAGVALAFIKHEANATVGQDAQLAARRIAVASEVLQPLEITWLKWDSFGAVAQRISPKLGVPEQVLTSYANASGEAVDGALAGSLNWFDVQNESRAWVGQGVKLTSTEAAAAGVPNVVLQDDAGAANQGGLAIAQNVSVHARAEVASVDVAGNISATIITGTGGGDGTKAVGGAFSGVRYRNSTIAGIDDGAVVSAAGGVSVLAESDDKAIVIAPSTGSGSSISGNGAAAYMRLDNVTKAAVSNRATVEAAALDVSARESLAIWSVAGAVNKSSETSVGVSVAVNDLKGDTAALIGNVGGLRADPSIANLGVSGAVTVGTLHVGAVSDGQANALAIAGAIASNGPPEAGKDDPAKASQEQTQSRTNPLLASQSGALQSAVGAVESVAGRASAAQGQASGTAAPKEQPKSAVALSGSATVNLSNMATTATITGSGAIKAAILAVNAVNNTNLVAASGGASVVAASAPSVERSAGVAGALAINIEDNDTRAAIKDSAVSDFDSVAVDAWSSGQHIAIGVGVALNTSTEDSLSAAGSASVVKTRNTTDASVQDSVLTAKAASAAGSVKLLAYDRTDIGIGGGALALGGATGAGVALAYGDIGNTVNARLLGTTVNGAGSLSVAAISPVRIMAGAAQVAATNGKTAAGASIAANLVHNSTSATVDASALKPSSVEAGEIVVIATDSPAAEGLGGMLGAASGALDSADQRAAQNVFNFNQSVLLGQGAPDGSSIVAVAGSAQVGKSAYGAALTYNEVANTTSARLSGSVKAERGAGSVKVRAADRAGVIGVALGIAGGTGDNLAGVGSGTVNLVSNTTSAQLGAAGAATAVSAKPVQPSAGDLVAVSAQGAATVWSAAGSAAASGSGASGGAALAYNKSDNDTSAKIVDATVGAGGGVLVEARHASALHTIAAAVSASNNKLALGGSYAQNTVDDKTTADVDGSTVAAARLGVKAGDAAGGGALIEALSGSVALSGKSGAAGVGISLNTVHLKHGANVAGSKLTVGGAAAVTAATETEISTLAMGVGGGDSVGVGLSSTTNIIGNDTSARLTGSSLNADAAGAAGAAAGTLSIKAGDSSTINSLAGAVGVATGAGGSLGAAIAVNRIDNQVDAALLGGKLGALDASVRAKNVVLDARSQQSTNSIAVGVGVGNGNGIAGGGSIAVSKSGSSTTARIDRNALVRAANNVGVLATNENKMASFAGGVGVSRGGVGVGLSTSVNALSDSTSATIGGNDVAGAPATTVDALAGDAADTIDVASGTLDHKVALLDSLTASASFTAAALSETRRQVSGLAVNATSLETISSAAVSVGAGKEGAAAATVATNLIGGTTKAEIRNARINQSGAPAGAAQAVDVKASTHAASSSLVGTLALSGGYSGGIAIDTEVMSGNTSARVIDSDVKARAKVAIDARSSATIGALVAGISVGNSLGGAGTGLLAQIKGSTTAQLAGGKTEAASLKVGADSAQSVNLIGGALGAAAKVGLGAAFAVIESGQTTRALLGDADAAVPKNTDITSGGDVDVAANTSMDNAIYVASAGLAGKVGIGLTAGVMINENKTEAQLARVGTGANAGLAAGGALRVHAAETDKAFQGAGAVGVGVAAAGVGATVAVTVTRAQVLAQVVDSKASSASLSVKADNAQTIDSNAVSVGAGLYAGVGGAVSLVQLGSADAGAGSGVGTALGNVQGLTSNNNTGESGGALSASEVGALGAGASSGLDAGATLRLGSRNSATARVGNSTLNTTGQGDAEVLAAATTRIGNVAGSAGAGLAGVGGSAAVTSVHNGVEAGVSASTLDIKGKLAVHAGSANGSDDAIDSTVVAGAAGAVGLGAAVGLATLDNEVLAGVGGNVKVGGELSIKADDSTSIDAKAVVVSAAAGLAVGLSYVESRKQGNVRASFNPTGGSGVAADKLTIGASGAGRVKAETAVGTGGIGAGAVGANHALADDSVNVTAEIGTNALVAVRETSVAATRTPDTHAKTYSVGVSGAYQVGVSESEAKVSGETRAKVGDGVRFAGVFGTPAAPVFGTLDVKARNLVNTNSAKAEAFAAGGGLLLGANGAVALAQNNADVRAAVGNDVVLPMSDVSILADAKSAQYALASGISVGAVGLGADVASASSDIDTTASLGSGAISAGYLPGQAGVVLTRGGDLTIKADGDDDNQATAVAGAGGLLAGSAAAALTTTKGSVNATMAGGPAKSVALLDAAGKLALAAVPAGAAAPALRTGKLLIEGKHKTLFFSKSDATQGSVAGGSGADSRGKVEFRVGAGIGAGASIVAADVAIDAFDKVVQSGSGDNASGVSGGAIAGAGMSSSNTIKTDTKAALGDNTRIVVDGDPLGLAPGNLRLTAGNVVAATDSSTVTAGGAFTGLTSKSKTDVASSNAVTLGAGSTLYSVGDLELGTYSQANVVNDAFAHGYGLAGGAGGSAITDISVDQKIDVGANARLDSWGNMRITAGQAQNALHQNFLSAKANNQVYFDGAFNGTDPEARARIHNNGSITVGAGSQLDSVRNIVLGTVAGVSEASADGDGHYTLLGVKLKNRDASTENDGAQGVTMNGAARAGTRSTVALRVDTLGNVSESTNVDRVVLSNNYNPLAAIDANIGALTAAQAGAGAARAAEIAAQIKVLKALRESLAKNAAAGAVKALQVGPLLAAGGNIEVNTGSIAGSGTLHASGGPSITLDNASARYLLVDRLFVPSELGGNVKFTGTGKPGAAFAAANVQQVRPNVPGTITISNTYDTSIPGNTAPAPAVFLNANIDNGSGALTVFNQSGDFAQFGTVTVNSQSINVPRGTAVFTALAGDSTLFVNGDPRTKYINGNGLVFDLSPDQQFGPSTPGMALPGGSSPDNASTMFSDGNGGHGVQGSADEAVLYVANYYAWKNLGYTGLEPLGHFLAGGPPWDRERSGGTGTMFFYPGNGYTSDGGQSSATWQSRNGVDTEYYKGRYRYPAVGARPLTNAFEVGAITPGLPGAAGGGIRAGTSVMIVAQNIDINGTIQAGLASDFSANIAPVKIFAGIDMLGNAIYKDMIACIDDSACRPYAAPHLRSNGMYQYQGVSRVNAADTQVDVYYDPNAKQLVMQNIAGGGSGYVSLRGAIINTNAETSATAASSINVSDGYAKVEVKNTTGTTLQSRDINTGNGNAGVIEITDTLKGTAGKPLTTWYVNKQGEGIRVYQSDSATDYNTLNPVAFVAGKQTSYQPVAGSRYVWKYDADLQRDFNVSSVWAYSETTPWRWVSAGSANSSDTPGQFWTRSSSVQIDPNQTNIAFRQDIKGGVTSVPYNIPYDYHGAWNWNWNIVTGVHITSTQSVKADYPFKIGFTGGREAGVVELSSNSSIVLGGSIQNSSGKTTLNAGGTGSTIKALATGSVQSQSVVLSADAGIGSLASPVGLTLTNPAGAAPLQNTVSALTRTGDIGLALQGADAVLSAVKTDANSDVLLHSYGNMVGDKSKAGAVVSGRNLRFISDNGAVGSLEAPLAIAALSTTTQSGATSGGIVDASAYGNIGLHQVGGDMYIGHVTTTADVALSAAGSLLDGRAIDSTDRSAELAALWDKRNLRSGAADSDTKAFENAVNGQYGSYWNLMSLGSAAGGVFTLNAQGLTVLQGQADASVGGAASADDVRQYAQARYAALTGALAKAGVGGLQSAGDYWALMSLGGADGAGTFTLGAGGVAALQAQADASVGGTATPTQVEQYAQQRYSDLSMKANANFSASAQQQAAMNANRYWTSDDLLYQINDAALQAASSVATAVTDTNISGRKVVLVSNGKNIGALGNPVAFNMASGLTDLGLSGAQKAALASANSAGDVINQVFTRNGAVDPGCSAALVGCKLSSFDIKQTAPLTLKVDAGLAATANNGSIRIQAQGVLPVEHVKARDEISISSERGMRNVAALGTPALVSGGNIVLQNGSGSIGDAARFMTLSSTGVIESARSGDAVGGDVYLEALAGNLVFNNLYATGTLALKASSPVAGQGNVYSVNMIGGQAAPSLAAHSLMFDTTGSVYQGNTGSPLLTRMDAGSVGGVVRGSLNLANASTLRVDGLHVDGRATLSALAGDLELASVSGPDLNLWAMAGKIVGAPSPAGGNANVTSLGTVTLNGGAQAASAGGSGTGIGAGAADRLLVAANTLDATTASGDIFVGLVAGAAADTSVRIASVPGSTIDVSSAINFTATSIVSAKGGASGTALDTGSDIKLATTGSALMTMGSIEAGRDLYLSSVDGSFTSAPGSKVAVTRDLHLTMTGNGTLTDSAAAGGGSSAAITAGRDVFMNAAALNLGNVEAVGGINLTARSGDITYANLTAKGTDVVASASGDIVGMGSGKLSAQRDAKLEARNITVNDVNVGNDAFMTLNGGELAAVAGSVVDVKRDLHVLATRGVTLTDAKIAGLSAGRDLYLDAAALSLNNVKASRSLVLNASGGDIDYTTLNANGGDVQAVATGNIIGAANGQLRAAGAVALSAANITVAGVQAGTNVALTTGGNAAYATVNAGKDVQASVAGTLTGGAGSLLQAGGNATLQAGALKVDRVLVGGNANITTTNGGLVGTSLQASSIALDAKTNIAIDKLTSAGLTSVIAGKDASIVNLAVGSDLTAKAGGLFRVENGAVAGKMQSTSATLELGAVRVQGDGKLDTTGQMQATNLTVDGNLQATAGTSMHLATASVGGDASLSGAALTLDNVQVARDITLASSGNTAYGTLKAGNNVLANVAGTLTGSAGSLLQAGGNATILAGAQAFDRVLVGGNANLTTTNGGLVGASLQASSIAVNTKTNLAIGALTSTGLTTLNAGTDAGIVNLAVGSDLSATAGGVFRVENGAVAGKMQSTSATLELGTVRVQGDGKLDTT